MDDRRDCWTPMIEASHPLQTGAHDAYATALEMVGNRHSKGALVDLVCWLVQRVDDAEEKLRTRGVALPREPQPVADVILVSGKVASCRERAGHGLPDGPHALYAAAGVKGPDHG